MKTWILVASRAGARILEHHGPGKGLTTVEEIEHADGRKKSSDIVSDRPGATTAVRGSGPHAMTATTSPHDRAAEEFARNLAKKLSHNLNQHLYNRLVLVAEPGFLGLLRSSLSSTTLARVIGTVSKDLKEFSVQDIGKHLNEVIAV